MCRVVLGCLAIGGQFARVKGDVLLPTDDSEYVALRRIPSDEQFEMEEGNELYTIPGTNPLYMSIDPHTVQGKTERRRERKRKRERERERERG